MIKLSAAMRKGRELAPNVPQTNGDLIRIKDGQVVGFCAEGCAILGVIGMEAAERLGSYGLHCYALLNEHFEFLCSTYVEIFGDNVSLERLIWDWNDKEKLSIRIIADKLEKLGY